MSKYFVCIFACYYCSALLVLSLLFDFFLLAESVKCHRTCYPFVFIFVCIFQWLWYFLRCALKFNTLKNVCYWSSLLTTPGSLATFCVIYIFMIFFFFSFFHFLSCLLWLYLCCSIRLTFLLMLCAL